MLAGRQKESARPIFTGIGFGRGPNIPTPFYLALKEAWRSRGRYFLISLVIALITTLVLFIAGLAEGLGAGNTEYLEKMNAELLVYQKVVDLSIASSRLDQAVLRQLRRIDGVRNVGMIGFSNASIPYNPDKEPLGVSLIGVEPGRPGEPPAFVGRNLRGRQDKEAIIGRNVALRTGLGVGDMLTVKTIQGTEEQLYELLVVGVSDGRQYSIQPSIFVPYETWDLIRPQAQVDERDEFIYNLAAVQLTRPDLVSQYAARIEAQVDNVQAVDLETAYKNTPGYSAQQSTLNTQRIFTLLIGVLVVGGFFQIQTLQKVGQVGMLKAIGVSNFAVALASLLQIVLVTLLGVVIGGLGTLLLSLSFPPTVPIVFTLQSVSTALVSLLLIGPMGGLVSIRLLLKVEPLTALGLGG